ncbi:MAG: helix-turn-helix transcriptional regulator [Oscillatoriales cyanobacterium C42_A2020_001]|nr:helix-turn-helix transcriptional regulator [Leptolyngbyaceae cyanobacterium C42_A2020_001]
MILVDPLIQQIPLSLHADITTEHPTGRLFGNSLAIALAARLLQNHSAWNVQCFSMRSGLPLYLRDRALKFIESHLNQSFTLDQLANELEMSVYYFCRQFKQAMGVARHQYVTRRRIEWAKELPLAQSGIHKRYCTPS